jgi:diaminopimelate decarboxylase
VDLDALAAREGTPLYVYSRATFEEHYARFRAIFAELDPLICFSIKTCGNIHLIQVLADAGAGMDVVSGGELYRALEGGTPPEKIVYAGVGKTDAEMAAALQAGTGWFNVESEAEFENLASLARLASRGAHAALRVNPDVADARTHEKTTTGKRGTKFGVDIDRAHAFFDAYGRDPYVRLHGIHLHLGSPIYSPDVYVDGLEVAMRLIDELSAAGHTVDTLNVGGGIPGEYGDPPVQGWEAYGKAMVPPLRPFVERGGRIVMEPGRAISANAGVLLTRVLYVKHGGDKRFVVVDAGMNTLIRPTLYGAYHFIWPTRVEAGQVPSAREPAPLIEGTERVDVVGPICESSDYLARGHALPPVERGDLLCIYSAGAYGMVMASQYNAQPRPAEVLVDGSHARLIRRRETYADLIEHERDASSEPTAGLPSDRLTPASGA